MKVKFGYRGNLISLPGHISVSNYKYMNEDNGGICIHPENVNEELFLKQLIDALSKYTTFEIEQALNKLE